MALPGIAIGPGITVGGGIFMGTGIPPGGPLVIPLNSDGGTVGYSPQAASIPYSATVIATYPVGSTITFQDSTTATITQWDDYGPTYIDIFWNTPKSGTIFPITLST
jgi:hypothetical protein